MIVCEDGVMQGSIGGGFMEKKLVELALSKLQTGDQKTFIKRQIHSKDVSKDQSGMICSGEQTVAFYFLSKADLNWVSMLVTCSQSDSTGQLQLDSHGIRFTKSNLMNTQYAVQIQSDHQWNYEEQIGYKNSLFIVGAGHVGLALSEILSSLGFYIVVLDDREGLNTMEMNSFVHRKLVIDYENIAEHIPEGDHTYIALVSFGYRTDKFIIKKLLGKKYRYIGMLGSQAKVKTLLKELSEEGIRDEVLRQVHAPIGIPIHSRTPREIAVSIAAEIIAVKNA